MIGSALEFIIALLLAWLFVFVFWRNYRIDKFRDQLFALRNELFDYAAHGGVLFDEPAYGILRNTMNGLLRYAERISFTHFILTNVIQRLKPSPVYAHMFQRWALAFNRLDDEQRQAMLDINARLNRIIAIQVMTSSPLPVAIVLSYAAVSYLHKLSKGMERKVIESRVTGSIENRLKPSIDIVEAQALEAQTMQMRLAAA